MFISMRQRETALSLLPLWVVYKEICGIFLNPHHQPPCSTQPLVTPDWSCNVFPLSSSLAVSHSLSLSLSPYVAVGSRKTSDAGKTRRRGRVWEKRNHGHSKDEEEKKKAKEQKRRSVKVSWRYRQSETHCGEGEGREPCRKINGEYGLLVLFICLTPGARWGMASALINRLTCDSYLPSLLPTADQWPQERAHADTAAQHVLWLMVFLLTV